MNLHLISGPEQSGKTSMLKKFLRETQGEAVLCDGSRCTTAGLARLVRIAADNPKVTAVGVDDASQKKVDELVQLVRKLKGRKDLTVHCALSSGLHAEEFLLDNLKITRLQPIALEG